MGARVIQFDKKLPSIDVPSPFEKAIDPTEIDEQLATSGEQQLRHANGTCPRIFGPSIS